MHHVGSKRRLEHSPSSIVAKFAIVVVTRMVLLIFDFGNDIVQLYDQSFYSQNIPLSSIDTHRSESLPPLQDLISWIIFEPLTFVALRMVVKIAFLAELTIRILWSFDLDSGY